MFVHITHLVNICSKCFLISVTLSKLFLSGDCSAKSKISSSPSNNLTATHESGAEPTFNLGIIF